MIGRSIVLRVFGSFILLVSAAMIVTLSGGAGNAQGRPCIELTTPAGENSVVFVGTVLQCFLVNATPGQIARLETVTEEGAWAEVRGQSQAVWHAEPMMQFTVDTSPIVIKIVPALLDQNLNCTSFQGRLTLEGGGALYSRDDLRIISLAIRQLWSLERDPGLSAQELPRAMTPQLEASGNRMLALAGLPEGLTGADLVMVAYVVIGATQDALVNGDPDWRKYLEGNIHNDRTRALLSGETPPPEAIVEREVVPLPKTDMELAFDLRGATGLSVETQSHPFDPATSRAVVTEVDPGMPAAQVGLRPGQRIVSIGNSRVKTADEVAQALLRARGQNTTVYTAGDCVEVAHPMAIPAAGVAGSEAKELSQLPRVLFPMAQDLAFLAIYRNELSGSHRDDLIESAFRIIEGISYNGANCLPANSVEVPIVFSESVTSQDGVGNTTSRLSSRNGVLRVAPEFEAFVRSNADRAVHSTMDSLTRQTVGDLAGLGGCDGPDLKQLLQGVRLVAGIPLLSESKTANGSPDDIGSGHRDWRQFSQQCLSEFMDIFPNSNHAIFAHICVCTEQALADAEDWAFYADAKRSFTAAQSKLDPTEQAELDQATRKLCPTPESPLNGTREDIADRYRSLVRDARL